MASDLNLDGVSAAELDPRDELSSLMGALRAHLEYLAIGGAFGVPKATNSSLPTVATVEAPEFIASLGSSAPLERVQSPVVAHERAHVPLPPRFSDPSEVAESPPPTTTSRTASVSVPPAAAVADTPARAAVVAPSKEDAPRLLSVLASEISNCTQCRLCEHRTQTVFARGTGSSGLCFVGEGPGADEDAQGFPFVGAAGQLLDKMISAMGIGRDEVYVCNIVKCRPPENRKPLPEEMAACRPYLERQLEILNPEVIVALGATAVEGLLGATGGITRLRGTWKLYKGRIAVMPTFHPAYLLRTPSAKHTVWEDMLAVLRHLGRPVPSRGKR